MCNKIVFSFFRANIGTEQESTLSSILSALCILSIFHIFEKRAKNLILSIPVSFHSFIDNRLFISQGKIFEKSNNLLFCSYNIITSLFDQFGLTIDHIKLEVFHFLRLTKNLKLSLLDLSILEGLLL